MNGAEAVLNAAKYEYPFVPFMDDVLLGDLDHFGIIPSSNLSQSFYP